MPSLVKVAKALAKELLSDKKYKHSKRVVATVSGKNVKIVAWLHDILEQTTLSKYDLKDYGFKEKHIAPVQALTRDAAVSYQSYIKKVKEEPLAVKVKIADVLDKFCKKVKKSKRKKCYKALKRLGENNDSKNSRTIKRLSSSGTN